MKFFLVYLFFEVFVSLNIATQIGVMNTFLELIGSALLGGILIANFRVTLMENLRALMQGEISFASFQRLNLWSILGAFLLILPGFLGDIIGLLLQFSSLVTLFVSKFLPKQEEPFTPPFKQGGHDDIIDVEVIDERHTLK